MVLALEISKKKELSLKEVDFRLSAHIRTALNLEMPHSN